MICGKNGCIRQLGHVGSCYRRKAAGPAPRVVLSAAGARKRRRAEDEAAALKAGGGQAGPDMVTLSVPRAVAERFARRTHEEVRQAALGVASGRSDVWSVYDSVRASDAVCDALGIDRVAARKFFAEPSTPAAPAPQSQPEVPAAGA